jgi:DNA-damage-inducible protein J
MSQTSITVRLDMDDKIAFENFCSSAGLSLSAAFNIYVKAVNRTHRIPFEISSDDNFYSAENMARLRHSKWQLENGHCSVHELIEDDENE